MPEMTIEEMADANALVFASHGNMAKVQELVIARPELVNQPGVGADVGGETPLAAASHTHNRAIAETLIAHGAEHDVYTAVFMGEHEKVRAFLSENSTLAKTPGIHSIPILSFATDGAMANRLIEAGAQVNAISRAPFQTTPLHGATRRAYVEVVEILLANGADATIPDYNGKTAPELATAPDIQAVFQRHGIATT